MVCNRCRMVVTDALKKTGIQPLEVELGEVTLSESLTPAQEDELESLLKKSGFELIDDKKSRTIEKIKSAVIRLIQENKNQLKTNLSDYLSSALNQDYSSVSRLFSEVEGTTIEQYYIQQKIEKVKELLVYDELSLSEIAFELGYSNVAHLSSQFKKVTGLTPSHFKSLKERKRKSIDEI
jgi:AraC-like DNA-binding protein